MLALAVAGTVIVLSGPGPVGCGGGGGGSKSSGGPAPNPTQPASSVCGGSVTSTPKLCSLTVRRAGNVGSTGYVTVGFCMSDLEGDVDKLCVGVAFAGGTPQIQCDFITPAGSRINGCVETDPIPVGPRGLIANWTLGFNVGDRAGHVSNTVVTNFSCCQ
jgi:hypothetical protein